MIDKSRLLSVNRVFFHSPCPDGTAAAMIVADTYAGLEWPVKFHPVQYDTKFHEGLRPEPGQLFVDITPPISRWREWIGCEPIVLDHHETAKEVVEGLGGVYATNEAHSGAKLAFEHVALPLCGGNDEWRKFAEVAMVRDTWKKDHPLWRDACAQKEALMFFGSKKLIEQVQSGSFRHDQFLSFASTLLDASEAASKTHARGAHKEEVEMGGEKYSLATFNCTNGNASDIANMLINEGSDLVLGYFFTIEDGEHKVIISARSNDRLSARAMAVTRGGGGHERAAGFRVKPADDVSPAALMALLKDAVREQVLART